MFWEIMIPPLYMPSLRPITSIQRSISDGFGEVHGLHVLAASQVGDGAGDLQNATVGTGGEGETLHRHAKHIHASLVGLGEEVNHALTHLGIAVDALVVLVSLGLNLPRLDDTLTDAGTRFAWGSLGDVFERNWRYLALDVDSVEKRT